MGIFCGLWDYYFLLLWVVPRIFLWMMLFYIIAFMGSQSLMQGTCVNRPSNHNFLDKDITFSLKILRHRVYGSCLYFLYNWLIPNWCGTNSPWIFPTTHTEQQLIVSSQSPKKTHCLFFSFLFYSFRICETTKKQSTTNLSKTMLCTRAPKHI